MVSPLSLSLLLLAVPFAGRPTSGISVEGLFVHGNQSGEIVALDARGQTQFEVQVSERPIHVWSVTGSRHIIATDDLGGIVAFDLGRRAVTTRIPAATPGLGADAPVLTSGQVYLEAPGGHWQAYALESGRAQWKARAVGLGSDGRVLLYASANAELQALAPSTGRPLFSRKLEGPARTPPAVDGDGVVVAYGIMDRKRRGIASHTLAEWTHEEGASPRWRATLPGTPTANLVLCGSAVGLFVDVPKKNEVQSFLRFDRLDGRPISEVRVPREAKLRCAGDLFVVVHPARSGQTRLLVAAPTGALLWERSDVAVFVGRAKDGFLVSHAEHELEELSAELGAHTARDRSDLAIEMTPAPPDQAPRRFVLSGEELSLPSKASISMRMRVYRAGVLEPSLSLLASDERALPPGLRLSRDGLLFGRARGLGLYKVPLSLGLPGRPLEELALSFRLVP